jgi:outer membrane protein assembly factor BamB
MDQYGEKTVSLDDGRHFYSATRCALDQIARWPADGLATYRLLFDGEVRQRLDRAIKSYDIDGLRLIARKFPYTTPGPDAMNLLAAWLLDRRQASEALGVLGKLEALHGDRVPIWQIISKRCVGHALAGQRNEANESLSAMKALGEKPEAALPADWTQRVASVEQFIQRLEKEKSADIAGGAWPIPGGLPAASGRMAAIDPAFAPEDFSRDRLPGSERINSRRISRLIKATSRSPVWQAASDGRSLFVTCPEGLIARDLATFEFLWRVVPRSRPREARINDFRVQVGSSEADNRDRLDELSTRTLWHEYRGAVTTAFGLVFLIEQSGTSGEVFPTPQGQLTFDGNAVADTGGEPNSIRAFEADTGRAVWTKGRSGPVSDELRTAHFFSPPVAIEYDNTSQAPATGRKSGAAGHGDRGADRRLIVPYQLGGDFFLAVLQPDGTLIKSILLGSGPASLFPINATLQPTVHDGTIFVPTGAGLFVALNSDDLSLRWLVSYERASASRIVSRVRQAWGGMAPGGAAPLDEWMASPPLSTAGLVLLAAPDSEYLVAYDREDGKEKWSYPRGSLRYLVASDGRRVIVAGKYVVAIDVADGNVEWMFDRQPPTGRPALSGEVVLVPTEDGLLRLDGRTGGNGRSAAITFSPG